MTAAATQAIHDTPPRRGRPFWRKAGLAAISAVFNALLIAALSLTALGVDETVAPPAPPLVYLDITPRPLLPGEIERRPPVEAPARAETPLSSSASARTSTLARPLEKDDEDDRPAPPNPRIATTPPAGTPAPPSTDWTVRSDVRGSVARSLRQGLPGCSVPSRLTQVERDACREDFERRASAAPPISGTGNPERDAAFAREGARRLAQWEAQRRPLSGGVGITGPADCVGSNFGAGCAGAHLDGPPGVDMRQGATTNIRQGSNKVD